MMDAPEKCPRTESLSALVDDALGDDERAALEAHVAGCAVCAPVLAQFRELHTRFAALPRLRAEFDVSAAVDRRISEAGRAAPERAPRERGRMRWWQVALAGPGGALAVGLGLWLGMALMPASVAGRATAAVQMAPFSALPPGALCPAPQACGGPLR